MMSELYVEMLESLIYVSLQVRKAWFIFKSYQAPITVENTSLHSPVPNGAGTMSRHSSERDVRSTKIMKNRKKLAVQRKIDEHNK